MCKVDNCEEAVYCKKKCMRHYNADRWASGDSEERRQKMRDRANTRNQAMRDSGEWPDFIFRRNLMQLYRLTPEQYQQMLDRQDGVCAICHEPPKDKRLHVDHNHDCCPTRKSCGNCIRGLLCGTCNTMIGKIERKDGILEATAGYLGVKT